MSRTSEIMHMLLLHSLPGFRMERGSYTAHNQIKMTRKRTSQYFTVISMYGGVNTA
jgi:hypothetical protein